MAAGVSIEGVHLPELGSAGVVVIVGAAADKAVAPLSVCRVVRGRIVDDDPRCNGHVNRWVIQPIIGNILQHNKTSIRDHNACCQDHLARHQSATRRALQLICTAAITA